MENTYGTLGQRKLAAYRELQRERPWQIACFVIALVALSIAAWLFYEGWQARQQRLQIEAEIAALRAE